MPLTSIVLPTHDRLALLREAIASVAAQTSADWQLVVVDDGSTDGTESFLRSLTDPRITCVVQPHSGVVAQVRNAGARAAAGAWLAFLDSDDAWAPGKLARQLPALERAGAAWSYTAYDHVDLAGDVVPARAGVFRIESGDIVEAILRNEVAVGISTLCVRRALFEELGGFDEDPALNFREDYEFVLRLAAAAPALGIGEVLTHVREHGGRATHRVANPYRRMAAAYASFARSTGEPRLRRLASRQRGRLLAEAGRVALGAGGMRAGWSCLAAALRSGAGPGACVSAAARGLARWVRHGPGGCGHAESPGA